jgi:hypothetical protein
MDVHIGEITSSIHVSDSNALLSPELLRQIVSAVLAELNERRTHEERRQADRAVHAGAYAQRQSSP